MPQTRLNVRVNKVRDETKDVKRIEIVPIPGQKLPPFTAGSHIDLHLHNGLTRQYSISSNPRNLEFYEIAVLKEISGSGGSKFIHDTFKSGLDLSISSPKNYFPLSPTAKNHVFLAGGIGITPMIAMTLELEFIGSNYMMHYCTRSSEQTAFLGQLKSREKYGCIFFHHDGGNPKCEFNIDEFLKGFKRGDHLYYCGPPTFMNAVRAASRHLPENTLHSEYFINKDTQINLDYSLNEFEVELANTGQVLTIPNNKTIIQVLRENNVPIDTSCEDGYCGTCMTRYLEGEPDHRDHVLDEEDRKEFVLICCARSKSPRLKLDL